MKYTLKDILFGVEVWIAVKRLTIGCSLWRLRGLKACKIHGFHAQSWVTGKCRKCKNDRPN